MNIKKLVQFTVADTSYSSKVKYLKKRGAKIGDGTRLNCSVSAFGSEPYLITIGEDCLFADGVNFITHDGGIKVLNSMPEMREKYFSGHYMDKIAPILVGNNVYIGMNAFVMPGVTIGDNCIIGANAIVTKDIPANNIAVGLPAKVICSVEEFAEKAIQRELLFPTATMSPRDKRDYYSNLLFDCN